MAISSFCSQCGAESVAGDTHCSACQQPLTTLTGKRDENMLLQGRYQLLKEIGAGGFGAVYLAQDTQEEHRSVAIKQIHLQGLTPQEVIEATDAFNREAEILSTLSHPLLPKIFDRFSDPEHWYLVISFIDGLTLDEYLQQQVARALPARRGLPLAQTITIALQLCGVLHYLHAQQPSVIFRDLKPGNVMITTDDKRLYLIDFGIARRFKPGQAKDTVPFGSPGFAAPEQYGRAQTTPQADIYSLGALLYCLISSDNPADHPFQFPALRPHNISGPYSNSALHALNVLIQRMVVTDPMQRPADILEVRAELQRIQQIQARTSDNQIWTPPPGQTPPAPGQHQAFSLAPLTRRKTTRRRVLTGSLVAGGVLAFGGTAVFIRNHTSSQTIFQAMTVPMSAPASASTATDSQPDEIATYTAEDEQNAANSTSIYWSDDLQHVGVLDGQQVALYSSTNTGPQMVLITRFTSTNPVFALQWSPDKRFIVLNCNEVRSVQTGYILFTLPYNQSTIPSANAVAWSPNGKYLAVGNNYSTFEIIDASNGTTLFQQSFTTLAATSIAWTADSTSVVVPVADAAGHWHIQIWNAQTHQKSLTINESSDADYIAEFTTGLGQISALYCAPDQQQIVFLCGIQMCLCNSTDANSIQGLSGYTSKKPLVWSPNAKYFATITDLGLLAYDTASSDMSLITPATNLDAFVWSADSQSITTVDTRLNRAQFPVKLQ